MSGILIKYMANPISFNFALSSEALVTFDDNWCGAVTNLLNCTLLKLCYVSIKI